MSSTSNNVKIPPMLPTQPLPINVVTGNVMYMYSCSQCEFKTHVESLFKQHVDSVHLGIPNVPSNLILGQNTAQVTGTTVVATAAAANVISVPQTIVMASHPGSGQHLVNVKAESGHHHVPGIAVNVKPEPVTTPPISVIPNSIVQAGSGDKLHKCPKCNVLLPSKYQLTQHKRKVHGKAAVAVAAAAAAVANQVPVTPGPNPGSIYVVSSQANQVVASLVSSQNPVVVSGTPSSAAALASAVAQASAGGHGSGPSTHPNVITTGTGTNLTGKKTYSCTACGYSTTRRDGLSQHYDSVHLKIKNHQCELCPYAASQKGTLNRHVKLRHKKKEVLS